MANTEESNNKRKLTLQDFTKLYTFSPSSVKSFKSMNDGLHYTALKDNKIGKYSYETGRLVSTLFDIDDIDQSELMRPISSIVDYSFNSDETCLLIIPAKQFIYRRSFTARYCLYDITSKKLTPLSPISDLKCASFSPDGKHIAFIRKNNIFIYDIENKTEDQITFDGRKNCVINGETDWVYEEEFEFTRAYEWSSDGHALAYIRFDETKVPTYILQKYKGSFPAYTRNEMYPDNYAYKYPKAGESNSVVSVYVYNLAARSYNELIIDKDKDIYIPRIRFSKDPQTLSIFHLNRHQNCLTIFSANVDTLETHVMYREENKCYIESKTFDELQFLDDGRRFVLESEETGYNHIFSVNINANCDDYANEDFKKLKKQITTGNYDVKDFIGFDEVRKLYYYSSYEDSPIDLYVYCIDENGNKMKITPKKGYNEVSYSKNFNYFIVKNSSADTVPNSILYKNDLAVGNNGITGQLSQIKVLEDNQALQDTIDTIEYIPKVEFSTVVAADGETNLDMQILKPKSMIEMEENHTFPDPDKKFPLLITLYGGPNHKYVQNSFKLDWTSYLVQEGFIVASIDPRGTAAHGEQFRKCTYLKLGQIETKDIIFATEGIISRYDNFIDKERVGIWGWSYGGFMSLLCLSNGEGVFSTSIAVAPVTNWKYYDTIYTERYMRTPQENKEGYEFEAPLHVVEKISPDAHLLICHGLCDDNVHFQNTAEYTEKLVQNDIQFDMYTYTNRNHGIYGGNTKNHLYTKFVNFLKQHMLKH